MNSMLRMTLALTTVALCAFSPTLGQELSPADRRTLCDHHSKLCAIETLFPTGSPELEKPPADRKSINHVHTKECCSCVFHCGWDIPNPGNGPLWFDANKAVTCTKKLNDEVPSPFPLPELMFAPLPNSDNFKAYGYWASSVPEQRTFRR